MKLFTIGYEKRDTDGFFKLLSKNGIDVLFDIRAIPYSRRKDFCKKALAGKLAEMGIEYVHLRELGGPKELRDKVRKDGDYDYFFEQYEKYLEQQAEALETLLDLARRKTACLLCYERDVNQCHRRAVAEELCKMADGVFEVLHL
jgi:uncharacterized protein (DUF488 family)